MKESFYNYFVPYKDKMIAFNGRTKSLFVVSQNNASKFKGILHSPDAYVEKYPTFFNKMKEHGFVCENNADEYKEVMDTYRNSLFPNFYRLLLLPTYRCNLRCWYCVQDHRCEDWSEESYLRIKKHLRKYLTDHPNIKDFYLSWFGGEPLIQYDKVVDFSSYAKNICKELGVYMRGGMTTNSLLLNEDRIKELGENNITFFQITLDGNRKEHNKVKCLPKVDTFTKALTNIYNIIKYIPNASVDLRINYKNSTLDLLEIIDQVNEIIPKEMRNQITVSPKKIWQEAAASIDQNKLDVFSDKISDAGYRIEAVEHGICYVDYKHSTTIYPSGKVDICSLDNVEGRAALSEDGDIIWNEEDLCFQQCADKENIICNHCKHFPMCAGPCPVLRNKMVKESGKVHCMFNETEMKEQMDREVLKYYREITKNNVI